MEAEVLEVLGSYNKAYDRARGDFRDLEARYPPDAPLNNSVMVRILRNLGRVEKSWVLGTRTLSIAEGMFRNLHPRTIRYKDNLARTYMSGGNAVVAIQVITECV